MTDFSSRRAELEARNAAMRENMTSVLEGISRQTEQLKQAQEQAVSTTGKASSGDGLVTVQVNSVGIVTDLQLSSSAFRSTTPRKLSETIVLTIQEAARNARAQADEAFTPILANMPDLPDIFPDAPSLKDLIPTTPEVPTGVADDADDDDDDEDVEDEFFASRREDRNY
jgi:DNA-binding protein YbaB